MPRSIKLFLWLLCGHGVLLVVAFAADDTWLAPFAAGTLYLPLAGFEQLGLAVFLPAPSGGWASPSLLGWSVVLGFWVAMWGLLAWLAENLWRRTLRHRTLARKP